MGAVPEDRQVEHPPCSGSCCQLCGRHGVELTRHHLIPRTRHRNKQVRKRFERRALLEQILLVCRPCHKQIHALFSEKELATRYNQRDALLADPDMARFVAWIRTKPGTFVAPTQRNRKRR